MSLFEVHHKNFMELKIKVENNLRIFIEFFVLATLNRISISRRSECGFLTTRTFRKVMTLAKRYTSEFVQITKYRSMFLFNWTVIWNSMITFRYSQPLWFSYGKWSKYSICKWHANDTKTKEMRRMTKVIRILETRWTH